MVENVTFTSDFPFRLLFSICTMISCFDLTGTLFSANDISGFPVLQADATGEVYIGKSPQSFYTTAIVSSTTAATTHSLSSLNTSSYDGAFFEYTAHSGSNARAGTIMAIQSGSSVNFTETTTLDFGSTTAISLVVVVTGSNMALTGSSTAGAWTIKSIVRGI